MAERSGVFPFPVRTAEKTAAFLQQLCLGHSVTRACAVAAISRRTAYDWREADQEFAAAWDEAVDAGTDRLEDEAHRRAHDGVEEPVFHQGNVCGSIRKYSDTLTIFLLKGRRPDKFRDNAKIEHVGDGGGPLVIQTINYADMKDK